MPDRGPSWREEARAMSEAVPYLRSQRIRRRLRRGAEASSTRARRHGSAMAAFVAGAALVLLSVFALRPGEVRVASPRGSTSGAPSAVAIPSPAPSLRASGCGADLDALADGHTVTLLGPCRVSGPGLQIVVAEAARLGGDANAIALDAGEAEFDIDPEYDRDAPFSVTTPAGRIEVTGTHFTVRHGEDGGALTLHEGHVRLVMAGRVQQVVAGQRITWSAEGPEHHVHASDPAEAAPPRVDAARPASAKRPGRRPSAQASSRALVEEVERLRASGEYTRAVKTLEAALPALPGRDREVLSFELGQLIERSRGAEAACAHWRSYAERFPRGRYADLVSEERTRLVCDASPAAP